jgi:hippurate hydrolase
MMQGTIRSYSRPVLEAVKQKITKISTSTAEAFDCKAEVDITDLYPPTVNHKTETAHVVRVAAKYIGIEHVKSEELPVAGSEDFSYYLENRPGCFFFLGTNVAGNDYFLHTSKYDYNDSLIATGALMFVGIVEDRLNAKIL